MSVRVVRCPNEHPVRVPDEAAGKKIKCRECGAVFVVPAAKAPAKTPSKAPAPAGKGPAKKPPSKPGPVSVKKPAPKPAKRRPRDEEEDEEEDRPRRRRQVDDDEDDADDEAPISAEDRRKERLRDRRVRLKYVNIGLLLHTIKMWASVVLIFAVLLMVIFGVISDKLDTLARSPDRAEKALVDVSDSARDTYKLMRAVFTVFGSICIVATPLVGVVGSGFCLAIPKKSGASGTILTSLVFDVICLVGLILMSLTFFNAFGLDEAKNERFRDLLKSGCGAFTTMALLLFMVFLRQLAAYLAKPLLGSDALNLVMYLVIQIVTFPIVIYTMGFIFSFGLGALGSSVAAMGFLFILSIVWFAQYYYLYFVPMLRLLGDIREVIEPKREKDEEDDEDEDEEEEDDD